MAAAVYSALYPDNEVLQFSSLEILDAIVERELSQLRNIAKEQNLKDEQLLAKLLAMAAIADVLPIKRIKEFVKNDTLTLHLHGDADIETILEKAGLLRQRALHAPKPDIVAAAFVSKALGKRPEDAPELIWAALEGDIGNGLQRIARLSHDAEIVLQIKYYQVSTWLAEALQNQPVRCRKVHDLFADPPLPEGWIKAAIICCQTLLKDAKDDEERALFLNNLSTHIDPNSIDARKTIEEAVTIRRRLSQANPACHEPDLAISLNNLATQRAAEDDLSGALKAIQEAVAISRRLSQANPARFESDLAAGLNNLSNCLSNSGDLSGALKAIQEAVAIKRRLAQANPARFEHDLAGSLSNLSLCLSVAGDLSGAGKSIVEAVAIFRRLSQANPASFVPSLARSLGVHGTILKKLGHLLEASALFQEAIKLVKSRAANYPQGEAAGILAWLERGLKNI